jgi:hypothetical protein
MWSWSWLWSAVLVTVVLWLSVTTRLSVSVVIVVWDVWLLVLGVLVVLVAVFWLTRWLLYIFGVSTRWSWCGVTIRWLAGAVSVSTRWCWGRVSSGWLAGAVRVSCWSWCVSTNWGGVVTVIVFSWLSSGLARLDINAALLLLVPVGTCVTFPVLAVLIVVVMLVD